MVYSSYTQDLKIIGSIMMMAALGPGVTAEPGLLHLAAGAEKLLPAVVSFASATIANTIAYGPEAGIKAGLFAAAFTGAGGISASLSPELVIAHALLGCAQQASSGGQCGPGAAAAAFGKIATGLTGGVESGLAQFAITTVVGGTASVIGGGKFANGAAQAAFGYLFNSLAHPKNTYEAGVRQAILRGDVQELRTLLGNGVLSADDALIAQRALTAMESLGAENNAMLAGRYGVDWANKVGHAFGKEMHNLGGLVEKFGSAERAFVQIQTRIDSLALPAGRFEQSLSIGGTNVTVRGFVQDGVAKIGTIFKP